MLSERVQSLRMPETGVTRRSRKHVLPWMLCGVLLLVTFWRGGLALNAVPASAPADADDSTEVGQSATSSAAATPSASGGAVAANGRRVVLESKGYIIAAHQILVSPKVSGTVTRLTFEEGKRVKKGDMLAEIEDIDYRTDYEHCVGECELARQKLLELEQGNRPEEIAQAKAQLRRVRSQPDPARGRLEANAQLAEQERGDGRRLRLVPKQVLGDGAAGRATALRLQPDGGRLAEGKNRRSAKPTC